MAKIDEAMEFPRDYCLRPPSTPILAMMMAPRAARRLGSSFYRRRRAHGPTAPQPYDPKGQHRVRIKVV